MRVVGLWYPEGWPAGSSRKSSGREPDRQDRAGKTTDMPGSDEPLHTAAAQTEFQGSIRPATSGSSVPDRQMAFPSNCRMTPDACECLIDRQTGLSIATNGPRERVLPAKTQKQRVLRLLPRTHHSNQPPQTSSRLNQPTVGLATSVFNKIRQQWTFKYHR